MTYGEWEKRYTKDYLKALASHAERRAERGNKMALREILVLLEGENEMPDNMTKFDNILPGSIFRVNICFMSEEETWINTYAAHPVLIPWYGCQVGGIQPAGNSTLNIWLNYEPFLEKGNRAEAWSEDHKKPES